MPDEPEQTPDQKIGIGDWRPEQAPEQDPGPPYPQKQRRRMGRPKGTTRGGRKRVIVNFTLSSEAHQVLQGLCKRPIAPLTVSSVLEHLILEAGRRGL